MKLFSQPQHPPAQREGGRSSEAQIRQGGSRFGATHAASGATVFQGNLIGVTFNSSAAAQPDFTGHFAHAVLEPVKAFVYRRPLHDHIHAQLARDVADNSRTKTLVVWGLGGAGKTQLVLDYVEQHRHEYTATFWIEAGCKESLERDFVRLYQTLFKLHTSAGVDTVISVEDAVTGVKSWFAGQRERRLMVFDGADTIEDKEADSYIDIRHFMPSAASLDIIITSRSSTAKNMTRLEGVQVGEMEVEQAAELFQKYAKILHYDAISRNEVLCIVKELGCLALAVTLAATYVGSRPRLQSDIKAYLPKYREQRRKLLELKPESLVHQYSESVLTTWETSYAAVTGQCREAAMLMTMLSFLSFDDIYLKLFYADGVQAGMEQTDETSSSWRRLISPQQPVDLDKIEECFAVLQKYSLVQRKAEQQGYAMHKLVHAWGYDRLSAEDQGLYSRAAFGLVMGAIEHCGWAPDDKLRLVPHVMESSTALFRVSDRSNTIPQGLISQAAGVGSFLDSLGRWPEARVVKEKVLHARRGLLGEVHSDTIGATSDLAITLRRQGHLREAESMQRVVLENRKQTLGEHHIDTVSAMVNLANTLEALGRIDHAAAMRKEVLEQRKSIFGDDHPETVSAMSNLANTFWEQGQLGDAMRWQQQVLQKRKRILGDSHPETITAMSNLAVTLTQRGGLLEVAAQMHQEVLRIRELTMGKDHPDTVKALNNVANMFARQGLPDQKVVICKEVLQKMERIMGENHPDTISAMSNLADAVRQQGHLEDAAEMQKEVLEKRERILGEEHPNTIAAMSNLAITLRQKDLRNRELLQSTVDAQTDPALLQPSGVPGILLRPSGRKRAKIRALLKKKLWKQGSSVGAECRTSPSSSMA